MSDNIDKNRIEILSRKWLNGTLNAVEQQEYDAWYASFDDQQVKDMTEAEFDEQGEKMYLAIQQQQNDLGVQDGKSRTRRLNRQIMVAASIGLLLLAAALFYGPFPNQTARESDAQEQAFATIVPGRDRAVLSMDNGTVLDLDSLKNGSIFQSNGVSVEKKENGELVYSSLKVNAQEAVIMNTISTPKGGQYKVNLSDGTSVWLNAASTLRFPSAFVGDERKVTLIGEAYFEVAKNKQQPFKVLTNQEEVEVLGTHFNVNAYPGEQSSVALLEGKVKVSLPSSASVLLLPGQQSRVQAGVMTVYPVDLSEAIAWKNGEFMFSNESIKSVMDKVGRWYDVEVEIAPELADVAIWGTVSKYENIKEVLRIIELTGSVRFKIEGRRIYVMV